MPAVDTVVQAVFTGILQGGVYALVSVGLTLIFGVMGIINFSQAEFMMLGMFMTFFLFVGLGINPLLIFFLVLPFFFVVGAIIEKLLVDPILEEPVDAQLVLTFGLLLILQNGALILWGGKSRLVNVQYTHTSFFLGSFRLNQAKLISFVFAVGLLVSLFFFLQRTRLGRAIRATADDKSLARFAGIDVDRVYIITFGLGIAISASAGALLVMYFPVTPTVGIHFIVLMFVVVILGGLGSVEGAAIAGIIIGILEQIGTIWLPLEVQPALAFVLFLLVVMFKPQGLFGTVSEV